ncbi:MAG: DUF3667 domain-containing protein [Acidobacteriota bacterium]
MSVSPSWTCPSCGVAASGRFCAACGEQRPDPHALTLGHFAAHAVEAFTHADSRLWRTLRALIARPGELTRQYVAGRHVPYMAPLQLFLVLNLVFFLALPWVGWNVVTTPLSVHLHHEPYSALAQRMVDWRLARGAEAAVLEQSFDHASKVQAKSLVILMVPVFALLSAVVLWRWRRSFVEHFVFALHFYAFWLLFQIVVLGLVARAMIVLKAFGHTFGNGRIDDLTALATLVLLAGYLYLALRNAYTRRGASLIAYALALAAGSFVVLQVYRFLLFLTCLLAA